MHKTQSITSAKSDALTTPDIADVKLQSVHPGRSAGISATAATMIVLIGTSFLAPGRLLLLLIPLSFILAIISAGLLMERGVHWRQAPPGSPSLSFLAIRMGVGLAALSILTTLCAFSGIFRFAGFITVVLTAHGLHATVHAFKGFAFQREDIPAVASGFVLGVCWTVVWLWSTIPSIFFDELVYHLTIPQQVLSTNSIYTAPWSFFTLMPHVPDLLLSWGMSFAAETGARASLFALWIICFFTSWGLAASVVPKTTPWLIPLTSGALISSSTFWFMGALTFSETAMTAAIMATATALVALRGVERSWITVGLLLGLVATTKLSGIVWVVALLASMTILKWPLRQVLKAGMVAGASILPWWIRAFVITGNPIYPMAYNLLGGRQWSREGDALLMADMLNTYGKRPGLEDILRMPLDLILHSERFGCSSNVGFIAVASVLVFLALPIAARLAGASEGKRRLADAAGAFLWITLVVWVWTAPVVRYFVPGFMICLTGSAIAFLMAGRKVQAVAGYLLVAAGICGGWQFISEHISSFSSRDVALGREQAIHYLLRTMDQHQQAAEFARKNLPREARILFIGETMPYYFGRDSVAPTAYDRHPLKQWVEESQSINGIVQKLREEQISHVVINVWEFERLNRQYKFMAFTGKEADNNDRLLKTLPSALRRIYNNADFYIFEVPK